MALSGSFNTSAWTNSNGDKISVKFSWTATQSIANNTSTISWQLTGSRSESGYVNAGGFKVVIDGETVYSQSTDYRIKLYNGTVIASGTKTIAHNSDGTRTFSASAQAGIYYYGINCTGSANFTIDTIPRASKISASNGTLGKALALTVSKASTAFTHTITYVCGSASGTIDTNTSDTSIPWTPPVTLAAQSSHGKNVSIVFVCKTFSDGTPIGTSETPVTCALPSGLNPTCFLAVGDQLGYTESYGAFVQGKSKFSVVVTGTPNANSKAAIKSYVVVIDGVTHSSDQFVTDVIPWRGTKTITATITDVFGNTASDSLEVTVLDYSAPIASLSCRRCDEDGTENDQGAYIAATCSMSISDLNMLNSARGILKCKKSSQTSYTVIKTSASGAEYFTEVFAADTGSSYDVVYEVTDDFSTVSRSVAVSTAFTIIHFRADGTGGAFGKVGERANSWEFDIPAFFNKGLYDEFEQEIRNGLSYYLSGGAVDCNTTMEELVLSSKNTPTTDFWFVRTHFYGSKTETSNRAQLAIPYNKVASVYYRYYNGAWSGWVEIPAVAEAGTSGIWSYIKWTDGRVELQGSYAISNVACTTALGGMYRTAVLQPSSFPFTVNNPRLMANYESAGYGAFLWATTETSTTQPPSYYLVRPTSTTISSGKIIFHVVGTW